MVCAASINQLLGNQPLGRQPFGPVRVVVLHLVKQ